MFGLSSGRIDFFSPETRLREKERANKWWEKAKTSMQGSDADIDFPFGGRTADTNDVRRELMRPYRCFLKWLLWHLLALKCFTTHRRHRLEKILAYQCSPSDILSNTSFISLLSANRSIIVPLTVCLLPEQTLTSAYLRSVLGGRKISMSLDEDCPQDTRVPVDLQFPIVISESLWK